MRKQCDDATMQRGNDASNAAAKEEAEAVEAVAVAKHSKATANHKNCEENVAANLYLICERLLGPLV